MSPGVFLENFERTEDSDNLHGVLDRALIIATRFDAVCQSLAVCYKLRFAFPGQLSDNEYEEMVDLVLDKSGNLNNNIQGLKLPSDLSVILHDARKARNEVAHSLARGLTGSIDAPDMGRELIGQVKVLMMDIGYGDLLISALISEFNSDPVPRPEFTTKYNEKIVNWVVEP